jgi:ABC-type transporter Mla subunit MlaD
MPQARRSATTTARRPRSLNRLEKSIEAAQSALKDLRAELGRGGRDLVKDLDKTLSDSRKNLRSLSRTVAKDLENLQKAATARRPGPSRARAGARKATTKGTRSRSTGR